MLAPPLVDARLWTEVWKTLFVHALVDACQQAEQSKTTLKIRHVTSFPRLGLLSHFPPPSVLSVRIDSDINVKVYFGKRISCCYSEKIAVAMETTLDTGRVV